MLVLAKITPSSRRRIDTLCCYESYRAILGAKLDSLVVVLKPPRVFLSACLLRFWGALEGSAGTCCKEAPEERYASATVNAQSTLSQRYSQRYSQRLQTCVKT